MSSERAGAKAQGLGLGLGIDLGMSTGSGTVGGKKTRAGSAGTNVREKERAQAQDKARAGSMHAQQRAGTEWWAASMSASTKNMPSVFEEDGQSPDAGAGAGGVGGAFGAPVPDEGGGGDTGRVPHEASSSAGARDEEAEEEEADLSDGSTNFYENFAEAARGKWPKEPESLHEDI